MPEAFCSHCGALRTSRTPVCTSCGGELDRVTEAASTLGIVAQQPRHLLIALVAALVSILAVLAFVLTG